MPALYHRIVKHLKRDAGMTEDHAWATAVNAVRRGCLTGDLNFPGLQKMSKGKRSEWCAAFAQWKKSHSGK